MRENRWVIVDFRYKVGRIRTVAVPLWVKHAVNAWQAAVKIEEGSLLLSLNKAGKVGESLSVWAIWAVVTESARQIGIERFGAYDLRRTCAKLCRKASGDLEQIKFPAWPFLYTDHRIRPWKRAGHRRGVDHRCYPVFCCQPCGAPGGAGAHTERVAIRRWSSRAGTRARAEQH